MTFLFPLGFLWNAFPMRSTWPNSDISSLSPRNSHPRMSCLWNRFWNNFRHRKLLSSILVFAIYVGFKEQLVEIYHVATTKTKWGHGGCDSWEWHAELSFHEASDESLYSCTYQSVDTRWSPRSTCNCYWSVFFRGWAQRDLDVSLRQSTFPAAGAMRASMLKTHLGSTLYHPHK